MRIWKAILIVSMLLGLLVIANSAMSVSPPGLVNLNPPPPPCYLSIANIPGDGPSGQIVVYSVNHKITLPPVSHQFQRSAKSKIMPQTGTVEITRSSTILRLCAFATWREILFCFKPFGHKRL